MKPLNFHCLSPDVMAGGQRGVQSQFLTLSRRRRGMKAQVGVRAKQSPEWSQWEKCVQGHEQGEPETNKHVTDGPSEATDRGKCDREVGGAFSLWLWGQALSLGLESVLS